MQQPYKRKRPSEKFAINETSRYPYVINWDYQRVVNNDVRYRFVFSMVSLKGLHDMDANH